MSTPYLPPDVDNDGDPGTALLFTPLTGVAKHDTDSSDLSAAVNALYFSDETRWPEEGGSNVPLKTWLVDSPDAAAVANWYAVRKHPDWLPGVVAGLPTFLVGTHVQERAPSGTATITEEAGTVPYVNPANSADPDAIYALNWILDNNP